MRMLQVCFAESVLVFHGLIIHVFSREATGRKDLAMTDQKTLPKNQYEITQYYIAKARRLRALAMHDLFRGCGAFIRTPLHRAGGFFTRNRQDNVVPAK